MWLGGYRGVAVGGASGGRGVEGEKFVDYLADALAMFDRRRHDIVVVNAESRFFVGSRRRDHHRDNRFG